MLGRKGIQMLTRHYDKGVELDLKTATTFFSNCLSIEMLADKYKHFKKAME
jgi:hypothetical protein